MKSRLSDEARAEGLVGYKRGIVSAIRFTKLQGLGNDFLIIPVEDVNTVSDARELARIMCERNYGAGADGAIFVTRTGDGGADFASRIFNADGSEAEISGNGTRCVAAYAYYAGLWNEPEINIATAAGIKSGRLVAREGLRFDFEFDMGEPRLASDDIPMALDQPLTRVAGYPLNLGGDTLEVTCVSMGNPHCTIFVPDLNILNVEEVGPLIEDHPAFPCRTNVEFARVVSRDEIEVIFWERGVGRTHSSGTGSCGASVAAMLNGLTERSVRVQTAGGALRVEWREDNSVALTGPAQVVYEGKWLP